MGNSEPPIDRTNSEQNATSASTDVKRAKKNNKSKPAPQKPNGEKKKSFRRSWKSASPITKLSVIFLGLAAFAALAYAGVTVWQTLEIRRSSHAQHMPLVIISKPPTFLQPFICDVDKKGLRTGNIEIGVKNIGNASAYRVMPYWGMPSIVPEKAFGKPELKNFLPLIDCKMQVNAKEMEFPLAPGREMFSEFRQVVMSLPPIGKEDPIQFEWAPCVYYSDEYGGRHGTCDNFRLSFPSTNPLDLLSGSPTFFCDGNPKMGKFIGAISGHCQE